MKRTQVKRVNRKRRAKRLEESYGPKAEWIRSLPCVLKDPCGCMGNVQAHHVRSRGAGGKAADLVPLCWRHHQFFHAWGRKTFEFVYIVNLVALAAFYEARWRQQGDVAAAERPAGVSVDLGDTPALTGDSRKVEP